METTQTQVPAQTNNAAVQKPISVIDSTLARINQLQESRGLKLPKDYSAQNAMRSAYLILQDVKDRNNQPVLQVCTKDSIANALLKMVVQGLNPIKRQCSFIAYGNILTCQREYQGSIAIAKRYGLKSVFANAIFKGDEFAFEIDAETGKKKITKHVSSFDSYGGEVTGAYAIVEMEDGSKNVEVMNMKQIQNAWNQGPTKGNSPAHKNFPDQMACKTVINRAVKTIINSSDDADLFEDDPITETDTPATASAKQEIHDNSGTEEAIGFDEAEQIQEVSGDHSAPPDQEATSAVAENNQQQELANQPGTQIKAPF